MGGPAPDGHRYPPLPHPPHPPVSLTTEADALNPRVGGECGGEGDKFDSFRGCGGGRSDKSRDRNFGGH